jgi:hypothetical protein
MANRKKRSPNGKVHWTQTPEGAKRMAKVRKKAWKARKSQAEEIRNAKKEINKITEVTETGGQVQEEAAISINYTNTQQYHEAIVYTHVTTWLALYSEFNGVSESTLTRELAEALLRKANW